jgi:hypothetical protein
MRTLAWTMTAEAATLAAAATLHLTRALDSGSKPSNPSGAGLAEAVICVVLFAGAAALFRDPVRGRTAALGAVGFAIFGFVVGLTFTISGGAAVDLAYHAVMLPILIASVVQLRPRHPGGDLTPGMH